jgi:hypothetical protein
MGHYKVRYRLGQHNEYVYPASMSAVAWKSVVYHATERVMVGETDADIKADGKDMVALDPQEAKKLAEEYASSYPKPKNLPPTGLHEFFAARVRKRR